MKDKQIEEMAKDIENTILGLGIHLCNKSAEKLYNLGYRKIDEDSEVIPKEISCYDNIEKSVRTFRLDGNKVDFTNEQIMALTQIFHFEELREKEQIRKETADKLFTYMEMNNLLEISKTELKAFFEIQHLLKK